MKKSSLIWLVILLMLVEPVIALTKYGIVRIRTGEITVVRDDQESIYVPEDGGVEIMVNDVLRMGQNSFAVLQTEEQTDIKMGSNAVFQVKPWKSRNKTGYLRMLYGKMNFKTKKLKKTRRFRFKTASATISVKGTGADCEVGSSGNTGCTGRSGQTEIQGNSGPSRELTNNRMSIVVGNRPASQVIETTPETGTEDKEESKAFAKASPTSAQSSSLSQEKEALGSGIVEPDDLEESKKEEVAADESLEQELKLESGKEGEEQEAETDEAFEKDLQESEEDTEVVELDTSAPLDLPDRIEIAPESDSTPELPEIDVEDDIEDAVQESKNALGRLELEFEK